mmetsp:Transcript_27228/g.66234  ORF Transcript_27228/g.66234 Transcript_27228/m.66234 type:complete len:633 (+) Transcript_27228:18-1916(+)
MRGWISVAAIVLVCVRCHFTNGSSSMSGRNLHRCSPMSAPKVYVGRKANCFARVDLYLRRECDLSVVIGYNGAKEHGEDHEEDNFGEDGDDDDVHDEYNNSCNFSIRLIGFAEQYKFEFDSGPFGCSNCGASLMTIEKNFSVKPSCVNSFQNYIFWNGSEISKYVNGNMTVQSYWNDTNVQAAHISKASFSCEHFNLTMSSSSSSSNFLGEHRDVIVFSLVGFTTILCVITLLYTFRDAVKKRCDCCSCIFCEEFSSENETKNSKGDKVDDCEDDKEQLAASISLYHDSKIVGEKSSYRLITTSERGAVYPKGGFSMIRTVECEHSGEIFIAKFARRANLRQVLMSEINFHRHLRSIPHKHIVLLHDTGEVILQDEKWQSLILPFATHGNLKEFLQSKDFRSLDSSKKTGCLHSLLRQLISAFYHLHRHGVVHQDIKPENVIVFDNDRGFSAKVCDFGLSKRISRTLVSMESSSDIKLSASLITKSRNHLGTGKWAAPEKKILHHSQKLSHNQNVDLFMCDVYSFGLVWEWSLKETGVKKTIFEAGILKGMLSHVPSDRPTMEKLHCHCVRKAITRSSSRSKASTSRSFTGPQHGVSSSSANLGGSRGINKSKTVTRGEVENSTTDMLPASN